MKVLVTGGAGKLGARVVESLVRKGHRVDVFDLPNADYSFVGALPNVQLCRGDMANLEQLKPVCGEVDVVLHLAAILPPWSEKDPEKTMLVNATGTENVVKALESTSHAPLVFSSSVSVYGRTQGERTPIATNHTLVPTDHYSKSKIAAEDAVRRSRLKYTILRISGVYAAEPFEFPSPVQFKAEQRVEFVAKEDVVSALVASLEGRIAGNIFNIAGGESWRMSGECFVAKVFEAFGAQGEVDYPAEYGYFDWYDTEDSERLLRYQNTSFPQFKEKLAKVFQSPGQHTNTSPNNFLSSTLGSVQPI